MEKKSLCLTSYELLHVQQWLTNIFRATLFRILAVREASQQKSLCGVDDTAAEGSSGFAKVSQIVEELQQLGKEKTWAGTIKESLQSGKRYFKTSYRCDCQQDESECSDHCRKFALSDSKDPHLQEKCTREHKEVCPHCEDIKKCLQEIEQVLKSDSTRFYSNEQKEDLLYDFNKAVISIFEWKSHIMRSANQACAKQDVMEKLDCSSILILMDWAMKFLQLRYREKQSEWYGKRGLSWHISSVVSRDQQSGKLKVTSYTHLFYSCAQDWYAAASVIENLLQYLKRKNPDLTKAYLRSDEAGCYHSNDLIAAVKDIGERVGIVIESYDYSEPQSGKDMCDRILCPMKTAIRTYCSEGHDILTASNMREALQKHPVKGTTASVNVVDESQQSLLIKKLDHISSFHNFHFDSTGIRGWKAYNIGQGKLFPYSDLYIKHQGPTMLQTREIFCDHSLKERDMKMKQPLNEEESTLSYECNAPGCDQVFVSITQLEEHLDVGQHKSMAKKSTYDQIRRDWAAKFQSVDIQQRLSGTTTATARPADKKTLAKVPLEMGWALKKPSVCTRFSSNVKDYLKAKFMLGEKTGQNADPTQVEKDMRNTRGLSNERRFSRDEWLTKTQIKGFFSRLAAAQRKNIVGVSADQQEDVECIVEDLEREGLIDDINEEMGLKHPITYDDYDLCDYYHKDKLSAFNVTMLKSICSHLEVPFKSKQKKADLIQKLKDIISECECCA